MTTYSFDSKRIYQGQNKTLTGKLVSIYACVGYIQIYLLHVPDFIFKRLLNKLFVLSSERTYKDGASGYGTDADASSQFEPTTALSRVWDNL